MAPLLLLSSMHLLLAVQAPQAVIVGVVRDEQSGAPLPGAVVTLPDLDRTTVTDVAGRYLLAEVPAGPQHLAVRFLGYTPRTIHALVPSSGRLEIGVTLRPHPLRLATLEVRPPLAVRGLDAQGTGSYPDREHSMAAVRNHPLLAEPDPIQSLSGGEVVLEPESPSGVHVRGAGSDQISYLLDGIPVFSPYHSAGLFSGWNPDALAGLQLWASAPPPGAPDALAGVVAAETRTPGHRHGAQGGLATTQARITLDGPIGVGGAGYLVSLRSGFAGYPAPQDDPSYLDSESGDGLAKLEAPAFGGRLRLLGYQNENEISAASDLVHTGPHPPRNRFEWAGSSFGAEWRRAGGGVGLRMAAWSAEADAAAFWSGTDGRIAMRARRHDLGLVLALESGRPGETTTGGVRLERSTTAYAVAAEDGTAPWSLEGRMPTVAAFARQNRAIGRRATLDLGLALAAGDGGLDLLPRARLAWNPTEQWTLSAAYAGFRQSAQSLRNPESVVGNVFPADLYIGSGALGVPEARARQAVIAADYRPLDGLRVGAQAYARSSRDLLLVAPGAGDPFAAGRYEVGSGSARGLSLSLAARGARLGVLASYGLQRVRLEYGDSTYVPGHGTTHLVEAGVIVFPTATLSIRLGATGGAGRRATIASGALEWEGCNLLDRGCELAGSPQTGAEPPGRRRLPAYFRADLGARQHWHLRLAGRDASVALFGTITNLFGRRNVLTYAEDPATGEVTAVGMRPLAPLVVGLDWRF